MGTVPVLLLHCLIRKRTKKQQKENSTTLLYRTVSGTRTGTVLQRIRYRTDEHSLGTRIRTVTRASEITRVPIYGPIRVA